MDARRTRRMWTLVTTVVAIAALGGGPKAVGAHASR